jgi:hypothetical protein
MGWFHASSSDSPSEVYVGKEEQQTLKFRSQDWDIFSPSTRMPIF